VQLSFEIPIRVYHEDTDSGGIVYYANYLKFMERARTEFLRSLGFEQDVLKAEHRCIFVVTHVDIDYRQPASFNQLLSVSCDLLQMRRASFNVDQVVRLQTTDGAPGTVLTSSNVSLACLHSETLAPARIPKVLSDVLVDHQIPRS